MLCGFEVEGVRRIISVPVSQDHLLISYKCSNVSTFMISLDWFLSPYGFCSVTCPITSSI